MSRPLALETTTGTQRGLRFSHGLCLGLRAAYRGTGSLVQRVREAADRPHAPLKALELGGGLACTEEHALKAADHIPYGCRWGRSVGTCLLQHGNRAVAWAATQL